MISNEIIKFASNTSNVGLTHKYTFRSLNSIILSLKKAKLTFPKIEFDIVVVDHNSKKNDLEQINTQLKKSSIRNSVISLDVNEFVRNIKKINAKKFFRKIC